MMKFIVALGLYLMSLWLAPVFGQMPPMTKAKFTVEGESVTANTPGQWSWQYFNMMNGKPLKKFMVMHEKELHAIIIKSDLSHFAHFHPHKDEEGIFRINANDYYTNDPDNFMTPNMTPSPGEYFVFTEVMPMGMAMDMMSVNRFRVVAEPSEDSPEKEVSTQPINFPEGTGPFVKYFDQNSVVGTEGDQFQVTFEFELFQFCKIWMPKFYFTVKERQPDGTYRAPEDFDKWLGMGGHAVMMSEFGETIDDRILYHLHGFKPMATPGEFTLPYHNHKVGLPDGNYRIWGQFKIHGQVLTAPFELTYFNPPIPEPSGIVMAGCR